jgi:hypothetical protein
LGGALSWGFAFPPTLAPPRKAGLFCLSNLRQLLQPPPAELDRSPHSLERDIAIFDSVAGENVDAACEKALFASAATVAAATSYAAARLELLSDMAAYVKHGGRDIDGALLPLL